CSPHLRSGYPFHLLLPGPCQGHRECLRSQNKTSFHPPFPKEAWRDGLARKPERDKEGCSPTSPSSSCPATGHGPARTYSSLISKRLYTRNPAQRIRHRCLPCRLPFRASASRIG